MADDAALQDRPGWLRRLRAGDARAFAEFVEKHKEMVFLCCRTLGLREDEAEDVASETFLAAYSQLARYKGRAKLSTWLWKIAYHKAISFLRKNRRTRQLRDDFAAQLADKHKNAPLAGLETKEKHEIIWAVVNKLPKLWAVAVILFYREEKSIIEIAKIMRIRQNTVKTYLFRARKKLREILPAALGERNNVGR